MLEGAGSAVAQVECTRKGHDALYFKREQSTRRRRKRQDALFEIEGPDEDGCVWICSSAGRDDWCQNLGPHDKVAEVLSQWLGSIDEGEQV
ncbi:MAG: hypothetical protein NVS3B5_20310 [Sphingomicrobium sp.]